MKRFTPVFLILAILLILAGDQIQFAPSSKHQDEPQNKNGPVSPFAAGGHDHAQDQDDHSDPEKNKRMGIFHFNEGNKSLRLGHSEEAVKNYKMALHHDPGFQETYINLSTTYLQEHKFDDAWNTLQSLAKINPAHPLLHYNTACYYSLTQRPRESLDALKKAVASGYRDFKEIKTDPDLENLRHEASYREWIQSVATGEKAGSP